MHVIVDLSHPARLMPLQTFHAESVQSVRALSLFFLPPFLRLGPHFMRFMSHAFIFNVVCVRVSVKVCHASFFHRHQLSNTVTYVFTVLGV